MTDQDSTGSGWREHVVAYFERRAAGIQPLAFEHVLHRAELGRSDPPSPVESSRRGQFLALVAATLVLLGLGATLASGWRPGDIGDETVAAGNEGEAPRTTESTAMPDSDVTQPADDADGSADTAEPSEHEDADGDTPAIDGGDPETPRSSTGEPLGSLIVLRDATGIIDRVSADSGEVLETIGSFPSLAAENRSPTDLVEGRLHSVFPDRGGPDKPAADVLLAVCCEPVGGNVYRLDPANPEGTEQPIAVGTRAVPTPDGQVVVYAITAYDFVVDGVELGVELDGMVDVAWINRNGVEGLAWLDVDQGRPDLGDLTIATFDRNSSSLSDVAEIATIELHRRSMASDGFHRLIVAGCVDSTCRSTHVRLIRTTDGTTVAEIGLDYGAMVAGVDPSGRILLIEDNGDVHLLDGLGEPDDVTDRVVTTGALWAGW